jgi:hypothetical protein
LRGVQARTPASDRMADQGDPVPRGAGRASTPQAMFGDMRERVTTHRFPSAARTAAYLVSRGGVPDTTPPDELKKSPGRCSKMRVAYPTFTCWRKPHSSSDLGERERLPVASTIRSAASHTSVLGFGRRSMNPVTRPATLSKTGCAVSTPSRKVTFGRS